jgi:hypothetical protein
MKRESEITLRAICVNLIKRVPEHKLAMRIPQCTLSPKCLADSKGSKEELLGYNEIEMRQPCGTDENSSCVAEGTSDGRKM